MADRRELREREEMETKQMAYVHYNGSPVKDGGLANKPRPPPPHPNLLHLLFCFTGGQKMVKTELKWGEKQMDWSRRT